MDDPTDRLLATIGQEWRDSLPQDEITIADRAAPKTDRSYHRPATFVSVAAIAASVLAVAVAIATWAPAWHPTTKSAPPTHATLGAQPCVAAMTATASPFIKTAEGTSSAVVLRNSGAQACSINAYGPFVDFLDDNGNAFGRGENGDLLRLNPDTIAMAPGDSVAFTVDWAYSCATPPALAALRIYPTRKVTDGGLTVTVNQTVPPDCAPNVRTDQGFGVTRPERIGH